MEWTPGAVEAWLTMRAGMDSHGNIWLDDALRRLCMDTTPGHSAIGRALRDPNVWSHASDLLAGRLGQAGRTGFSIFNFELEIEHIARRDRARAVGERHVAAALAARGEQAFSAFILTPAALLKAVREIELGPEFDTDEVASRWHGLIDTSVAVEYRNLPDIDWLRETQQRAVTLWISSVLLDELDDMKYRHRSQRVTRRAQAFTRWISPLLPDALTSGGAPLPQRPGVVVRAWAPQLHQAAPDSRHLEAAFALLDRGVPVRLITGDTAQRLRALARGVEVFELRDNLRLPAEG